MPQFGDVIFFKSDGSLRDRLIQIVSPNSVHVGLFLDNEHFIEANNPLGIVITKYNTRNYKGKEIIKRIINKHRVTNIDNLVYKHLGEKYSILNAIQVGLFRKFGFNILADQIDKNWICSEWVGYLLRNGFYLNFCPNKSTVALLPDDLLYADIYQ